MCTLTVLPSSVGTIVSMNRDEADSRAETGEHLELNANGELQTWWPIDSVSQGTWFGVRGDGLVAALLNRYQGHGTTPKRSRGLIIPWVLANAPAESLLAFINAYDWSDFAPFDLVLVFGRRVLQCSWEDGVMQVQVASSERPYFLSSSSQEYEASMQIRRTAFEQFIALQSISPEHVIEDLHRKAHPDNPTLGLLMRRPGRSTRSISQAVVSAQGIQHRYIPLH